MLKHTRFFCYMYCKVTLCDRVKNCLIMINYIYDIIPRTSFLLHLSHRSYDLTALFAIIRHYIIIIIIMLRPLALKACGASTKCYL